MIVHRHGVVYFEEYGWADVRFEGLVAQIAADFLAGHDSTRERCWIAEKGDQFVGSIMLVKDPELDNVAKLRVFLVEPKARGLGVGKTLLRLCVDFAREVGYKRIRLQTEGSLDVARHMYKREGFEVVEKTKQKFDFDFAGEIWEMEL